MAYAMQYTFYALSTIATAVFIGTGMLGRKGIKDRKK